MNGINASRLESDRFTISSYICRESTEKIVKKNA